MQDHVTESADRRGEPDQAESLIAALCDLCTSTAELTGLLGLDPELIRIEKPSDPGRP